MEIRRVAAEQVAVDLSYAEAVVLSDLLNRWDRSGLIESEEFWEHQAEQRVIWDLTAGFEPVVGEAFSPDYQSVVASARAQVADGDEAP